MSHLILLVLHVLGLLSQFTNFTLITSRTQMHVICLLKHANQNTLCNHWNEALEGFIFLNGFSFFPPLYHSLWTVCCAGARPPEPHPLLSGINTLINSYASQYASLITSIIYLAVHLPTSLLAALIFSLYTKT